MGKIVKFEPKLKDLEGTKQVSELLGKTVVIVSVDFGETHNGVEYAVFETSEGNKYRTWSKVLISQLKDIQKLLHKCEGVKVNLKKKNRYYTF